MREKGIDHDPAELLHALAFALEKYPERIEAIPIEELVLDSARQNAKRPAFLKIAVADETVKSLRGSPDRRENLVLVVSIPKEVEERSQSLIVLPGEV